MLDSVFGEVSDKSSYFPCPFSEVQSKYDHFLNNTKKNNYSLCHTCAHT